MFRNSGKWFTLSVMVIAMVSVTNLMADWRRNYTTIYIGLPRRQGSSRRRADPPGRYKFSRQRSPRHEWRWHHRH